MDVSTHPSRRCCFTPQHGRLEANWFKLLLLCFIQICWAQRQSFVEVPESVEVVQGSKVTLRCAVQEQQGRAQWTKDGFALGFERDVPGYPRYRYEGDPDRGQHYLVITGATLQDDGEYQCQVGPATMAAPIWASASLTVLVPPSAVRISLPQRQQQHSGMPLPRSMNGDSLHHPPGSSSFEHNLVNITAGSTLTMHCLVSDARPAPTASWYKDGDLIDPSLQQDTVVAGSQRLLSSMRSELRVTVAGSDDGVQYWCRARHAAIQDANGHSAVDSVTLVVLHPPNAPVIRGPRSGVSGQTLILGCRAGGGNPKAEVSWYLDQEQLTPSVKEEATVHVMLLPRLHKALLTCRAESQLLSKPMTATTTLTVHYAPEKVTVEGPESVRVGESFNAECHTSPANPPANLSWAVDGRSVFNDHADRTREVGAGWISSSKLVRVRPANFQGRHVEVVCTAAHPVLATHASHVVTIIKPPGTPLLKGDVLGLVIAGTTITITCRTTGGNPPPTLSLSVDGQNLTTTALLEGDTSEVEGRLNVLAQHNGALVLCTVTGAALGHAESASTTLEVAFSAATVSGRASPAEVDEGSPTTLTCDVSSINPPPRIIWWSGGIQYRGAEHTETRGEFGGVSIRSVLVLQVSSEDHQRTFTCEAANGVTEPTSDNITIAVRHAPIWIVSAGGIQPVKEGESLTVTVLASTFPGPLRYTWERGGHILKTKEYSTEEINRTTFKRGTQTAPSQTLLNSNSRYVMAPLAQGSVFDTQDTYLTGPDTYSEPDIKSFMYGASSRDGNLPGHGHNRFLFSNEVFDADNLDFTGQPIGLLKLKEVSRKESGKYSVIATSPRGSTNSTFIIEVMYPPEGVVSPPTLLANAGEDMVLDCVADGNPKPIITWVRLHSPYEHAHTGHNIEASAYPVLRGEALRDDRDGETGKLQLLSVTASDTGAYQCIAENSVGKVAAHPSKLIVAQPPFHENINRNDAAWAAVGGSGTMECRVRGAPAPTFTWERRQDDGDTMPKMGVTSGSRVTIHPAKLLDGLVEWSSRLEIRAVGMSDYGYYTCHARNNLGHTAAHYSLRPPKPPDTPTNMTVVDVTTNSVTLRWISTDSRYSDRLQASEKLQHVRGDITKYSININDNHPVKSVEKQDNHQHHLQLENQKYKPYGQQQQKQQQRMTDEYHAADGWQSPKNAWHTSSDETAGNSFPNVPLTYIVRYQLAGTNEVMTKRVSGTHPPSVTLDDLAPGRSYNIRVLASSEEGTSPPSAAFTVTLAGNGGGGITEGMKDNPAGVWRAPRLLLLIMAVTGSALLALNLAIIVCFVRRRNRENRNNGLFVKSAPAGGLVAGDGSLPSAGTVGAALLQDDPDSCPTSIHGDDGAISSISLSGGHMPDHNRDTRRCSAVRMADTESVRNPTGESPSAVITSEPDLVRPSYPSLSVPSSSSYNGGETDQEVDTLANINAVDQFNPNLQHVAIHHTISPQDLSISRNEELHQQLQHHQHQMQQQLLQIQPTQQPFAVTKEQRLSPYASLSPANLCELGSDYYSSSAPATTEKGGMFATLAPRIRSRQQAGCSSTLQRPPPLPKAPPIPSDQASCQRPDITRDLHARDKHEDDQHTQLPPTYQSQECANNSSTHEGNIVPDLTNHIFPSSLSRETHENNVIPMKEYDSCLVISNGLTTIAQNSIDYNNSSSVTGNSIEGISNESEQNNCDTNTIKRSSRRNRTCSERSSVSLLLDERGQRHHRFPQPTDRGERSSSDGSREHGSSDGSRSSSSLSGTPSNSRNRSPRHSKRASNGNISDYLNTDTIRRSTSASQHIVFSSSYSPPTIYYTARHARNNTPEKHRRKKSFGNCSSEDVSRTRKTRTRSRESLERSTKTESLKYNLETISTCEAL